MLLPPLRAVVPQYQPSKKKKGVSLNRRNSEKHIQYAPKIIKPRYYTEEKDCKIGKKLLNYISFDRVKTIKNYTQQCQQNMKKFQEEKEELKQLQSKSQRTLAQTKRLKLHLNPNLNIHIKTEKNTLEMNDSRKRIEPNSRLRERIRTQITGSGMIEVRMKLKHQMQELQQNCLRIKKYSQMSIQQIIEKDTAESSELKRQLFYHYRRPHLGNG